jgi:hypothetical protein
MANDSDAGCLVCNKGSREVPLIAFRYQGSDLWICPRHLPILIHDPAKLAGTLPGAEGLTPASHHD